MIPSLAWLPLARDRARELLGINARNLDYVFRHNPRKYLHLVDDKLRTKELLAVAGIPVPRTLAVVETLLRLSAPAPWEAAPEGFVIKPVQGSRGNGILVVSSVESGSYFTAGGRQLSSADIVHHIGGILQGNFSGARGDRALVEVRVEAHPLLASLGGGGLPDLRIILFHGRPVMAMLRLATRKSGGRANLHQGGLGLAVDIVTGKVTHAMSGSRVIERHPDSGAVLANLSVPRWKECISVACRAATQVPLGFLGVDLVIDKAGRVLVLEMNARPGLQIQNVNRMGLRGPLEEAASQARLGGDAS